MMADAAAVLELAEARAVDGPDDAPAPTLSLRLAPGDLVLVQAYNPVRASWFADLCCGMVPLADGAVRFLGRDWARMPHDYAAALRGRIGRTFNDGGWIEFVDVANNILLPQLHHTRRDVAALRAEALGLAADFGLPGLPLSRPQNISPADLVRAACVRALMGEPALLVLDNPLQNRFRDLLPPLLEAVATARGRGVAVVWLTDGELTWRERALTADYRLRLTEHGLVPPRRAA
jgi:phospholipid/cholesterol/gamma-HCH transport system ATP-binding protein